VNDEYPDLEDWIRPGAKLASLSYRDSTAMLTVTKITKTQIVCVSDTNPDADYRFERTAIKRSTYDTTTWHYLRGNRGVRLVQRNHPDVVRLQVAGVARQAATAAEEARKRFGNPEANGDERPVEERALTMLDDIENAARAARHKILNLIARSPELSGHADGQL